MEGCVVYLNFLVFLLSTGTVLCTQDCPSVGSGQHWNKLCQIQTERACDFTTPSGMVPSAPRNLRVVDYPYMYSPQQGSSTLAINITWQLPENITELGGFKVELMKASYPVGFQECKKITFETISSSESHLSTVNFTLSDWHDIDVDGKYIIKVTSLDSGQVAEMSYHTKRCTDVPQVNKCLIARDCSINGCQGSIEPPLNWKPTIKPTVHVSDGSDIVKVIFQVYPGDFWLDYQVNLWSRTLLMTRPELSRKVNSNGSSPYYTIDFDNVPPDEYIARVHIVPGDTYWVDSEPFSVTAFNRIIPTVTSKTTRVPVEPTFIQVTKPSHTGTPGVASKTTRVPVGPTSIQVTKPSRTGTPAEQEPESVSNVVRNAAVAVSAMFGVFIALLIFIGLYICRRKFKQRSESSESATSRPCETSCLQVVNGISPADGNSIQNNDNGVEPTPSNCGDSYLQGSIWTDFSEGCGRQTVKGINYSDFVPDLSSLADAPGISV